MLTALRTALAKATMRDERSWSSVPAIWRSAVLLTAAAVIALAQQRPAPAALAQALPAAPSHGMLRVMSTGEQALGAKLILLWLQAFDNQPGISIPFKQLDYGRVQQWLDASLMLDPQAQLALLMASRVYAQVNDPPRQRAMLDYVAQRFMHDPNHRWPWLAHAVYVARHELQDAALAARYANLLAQHATVQNVPGWAKQMHALIQADMNNAQAAAVLLGALLESGTVQDPAEFRFLQQRLEQLKTHSNKRQ